MKKWVKNWVKNKWNKWEKNMTTKWQKNLVKNRATHIKKIKTWTKSSKTH